MYLYYNIADLSSCENLCDAKETCASVEFSNVTNECQLSSWNRQVIEAQAGNFVETGCNGTDYAEKNYTGQRMTQVFKVIFFRLFLQ